MRGPSGSGKSTAIQNAGIAAYTLSADAVRLMYQSPMMSLTGMEISQKNNRRVWSFIMQNVEERMTRGEFIVVDATHRTTTEINNYRALCEKYRYRCTVCQMDTSIDVAQSRNNMRPAHQIVRNDLVEAQAKVITTEKIPAWVKVINQDELLAAVTYEKEDYSNWDRIHHIGDIQGCYDPLAEYFAKYGSPKDNPTELYIFTGDMLDRGIQNGEVMEYILTIYTDDNVRIIEGNHEIHISNWAQDQDIRSEDFRNETKPQLEAKGITKKKASSFFRRLRQMIYYGYKGTNVFVSHGGLASLPVNPMLVPTIQYIKGVGEYSTDIDEVWNVNMPNQPYGQYPVYQIHGHRNINGVPSKNGYSFNLEGSVEFFGHLRVAVLDEKGWHVREIESKNCKVIPEPTESKLLRELRTNKYVIEKQFGDVSSFNFSRDAFHSKKWNSTTTKARGLFINTQNNEIVARSYDKFFNVGELSHTEWDALEKTLVFPVNIYQKENGFLGITGWDTERGCRIITSKSSLTGDFSGWFSDILLNKLGKKADAFFRLLEEEKISAVFEVIDPINDPHMVQYNDENIVLLDLVYRTEKFEKLNYSMLCVIALKFDLDVKKMIGHVPDYASLRSYIDNAINRDKIEGVLIEDSKGFMVKVKYGWYSFWKQMRNVKEGINKGWKTKPQYENLPVVKYMSSLSMEMLDHMSIIDVRNGFIASGGEDII